MIIILACGGSGTNYISEIFKQIGLQVGHEQLGKDGIVDWRLNAFTRISKDNIKRHCKEKGISTSIFTYLDRVRYSTNNICLHQVRHPLKNISSSYCWLGDHGAREYLSKFSSINLNEDKLLSAMKYWYEWNRFAEYRASFRYQIEKLEEIWSDFCRKSGINTRVEFPSKVSKQIGTRSANYFTWENLRSVDSSLTDKIIMQANRYGYQYN